MTLATIKEYYEGKDKYMMCPHSAVGVSAINQLGMVNSQTVALATAHEGKFPDACKMAVDPLPTPPKELSKLWSQKTRSSNCPNDLKIIQAFMEKRIAERIANEGNSSNGGALSKIFSETGKQQLMVCAGAALAMIAAMSIVGGRKR